MALQVAERAVVGDEFEAVVGALEGAPGPVAAVAPLADVGAQQRHPVVVAEPARPGGPLALGAAERARNRLPTRTFSSPSGSKSSSVTSSGSPRRVRRLDAAVTRSGHRPLDQRAPCRRVVGQVGGPLAAPLGHVDPLEERRDDLAQLGEHHVGVVARLGQRVGAHAQQQLLVGLARAVDADVGQRRRRQQPAQRVERLGPRRLAVDEVAVPACWGNRSATDACMLRQQRAVGVEDAVHLADEARRHGASRGSRAGGSSGTARWSSRWL